MNNKSFDYKRIAEGYKDRPFLHKQVMEQLKNDMHIDHFQNGLDVGCGAGLSTRGLKLICDNVTGTDISEENLRSYTAGNSCGMVHPSAWADLAGSGCKDTCLWYAVYRRYDAHSVVFRSNWGALPASVPSLVREKQVVGRGSRAFASDADLHGADGLFHDLSDVCQLVFSDRLRSRGNRIFFCAFRRNLDGSAPFAAGSCPNRFFDRFPETH